MLPSRGAMLLLCTYHGGLNVATLRHEACYWLDHQKKTKDKRHRTRNLMQPSHLWIGKLQYITFSWIVGIYQPTNIQQCTSLFCQMPDLSDNQAGLGLNLWQHMIRCYNFIVFFFFFFYCRCIYPVCQIRSQQFIFCMQQVAAVYSRPRNPTKSYYRKQLWHYHHGNKIPAKLSISLNPISCK